MTVPLYMTTITVSCFKYTKNVCLKITDKDRHLEATEQGLTWDLNPKPVCYRSGALYHYPMTVPLYMTTITATCFKYTKIVCLKIEDQNHHMKATEQGLSWDSNPEPVCHKFKALYH